MRRKAFTLVELMVGMIVMGMLIIGTMTIFSQTMTGFYKTKTDIDLAGQNSLGVQRIAETLRSAYSMNVQNGGNKVQYFMPKVNVANDPDTGEKELTDPIQSDGTARSFTITGGKLIDDYSGRTLASNIVLIDPDPNSSQYNQTYAPFQLTTIGSRKALSINLITQSQVLGNIRYERMKTTVIIRNSL